MRRAFTLIELIIVIIIVGILAAVGLTQYSRTVEKGRASESRANIGLMRKLATAYLLENGSFSGLQNSDVGVGSGVDQLPTTCNSSYWYDYHSWVSGTGYLALYSFRCLSGGKPPQGTQKCGWRVTMYPDGTEGWYCVGPDGSAACPGGC